MLPKDRSLTLAARSASPTSLTSLDDFGLDDLARSWYGWLIQPNDLHAGAKRRRRLRSAKRAQRRAAPDSGALLVPASPKLSCLIPAPP
jgi:hypothetical protein